MLSVYTPYTSLQLAAVFFVPVGNRLESQDAILSLEDWLTDIYDGKS